MERVKKTIPDRPVAKNHEHVLEREVLPVLKQLRDGHNKMAPAGEVTIEGTDLYMDVVFDVPEPDAEYLVTLTVQGVTGDPPASARRPWCPRKDIYGFRVQLQYRPGTDNSVAVAWNIRR